MPNQNANFSSQGSTRNASTLLTIYVKNSQPNPNSFFFFQKPAIYVGGPTIFSNSLFTRGLGPSQDGGQITFQANIQYYAGVQDAASKAPSEGQVSGFSTASQPISLAAPNNQPTNADACKMLYSSSTGSLGLSQPVNDPGVPGGNFRIVTATYSSPPKFFNAGSAIMVNGGVVLSNFVNAQPQTNVDCQPILTYYVNIGGYAPGTVMNFTTTATTAALCDFTPGYSTANVTYNQDGSWDVQMS